VVLSAAAETRAVAAGQQVAKETQTQELSGRPARARRRAAGSGGAHGRLGGCRSRRRVWAKQDQPSRACTRVKHGRLGEEGAEPGAAQTDPDEQRHYERDPRPARNRYVAE
jgi:hypothetical protein